MSEIIMNLGEQSNTELNIPSSKIQTSNSNWVKVLIIIVLSISTIYLSVELLFREPTLNNVSLCEANFTEQETDLEVCATKDCLLSAYKFLQTMNESVDPCEDFYMFSCGGFLNSNDTQYDEDITFKPLRTLVDERLKGLLEEVDDNEDFKLPKTLYQSCLNHDARYNHEKVFQKTLDDIGLEWPVLSEYKYNQSEHPLWDERIYKIKQFGLSGDYLMSFSIEQTVKNSKLYQIHIDPPKFGLNRPYLVNGTQDPELITYSKEQLGIVYRLVDYIYDSRTSIYIKQFVPKDVFNFVIFEMNLANATLASTEKHNLEQLDHPMQVSQLEVDFPKIPWVKYINTMLSIGKFPVNISTSTSIIISEPKYFTKLNELLQYAANETIANYIMWRAVNDINKLLEHGVGSLGWKSCVKEVRTIFQSTVGSMYIQRYYDTAIEPKLRQMDAYIWYEILNIINQTDWLDSNTKEKVYKKVEEIQTYFGSLGVSVNGTKIFKGMEMNETDYVQNILNYNKFRFSYSWWRIVNDMSTGGISSINPTDDNAYYDQEGNFIVLPAAILQGFIYNEMRPMFINYGILGWIIGHETAHSLDNMGIQYDQDGHVNNWWSSESKASFQNRSQCYIEQYGNYTVSEVGLNVNGANTLSENIADNLGIIAAYKAYQSWTWAKGEEYELPGLNYTANQIFWISATSLYCMKQSSTFLKDIILTDGHSPNRVRVLGSLSNSPELALDFNCPLGSKMNPVHKCKVYGQ